MTFTQKHFKEVVSGYIALAGNEQTRLYLLEIVNFSLGQSCATELHRLKFFIQKASTKEVALNQQNLLQHLHVSDQIFIYLKDRQHLSWEQLSFLYDLSEQHLRLKYYFHYCHLAKTVCCV